MRIMGRLAFDVDADVIKELDRLIPGGVVPNYRQAVGFVHDGRIAGGVLFFGLLPGIEIEFCMGASTPRVVTRSMLRELIPHAFREFEVNRITAHTDMINHRARSALERAGFRFEGVKRKASPRGDVAIYGLLKEDYKL